MYLARAGGRGGSLRSQLRCAPQGAGPMAKDYRGRVNETEIWRKQKQAPFG